MKPSLKAFEREEEEIVADFEAGLISKYDKDKAIKELWNDYKALREDYVLEELDEDNWDD